MKVKQVKNMMKLVLVFESDADLKDFKEILTREIISSIPSTPTSQLLATKILLKL